MGWLYVMKQIDQEDTLPIQRENASIIEEKSITNGQILDYPTEKEKMEKEMRASELKFRRVFECSMDGLILWDNQFRIVDINCAAEKILGLSEKKIKGCRFYDLFPHQRDKKKEIIHHIEKVIQDGEHNSSIEIDTMDGRKRYFDYSTKKEIVEGLNFTIIKDVSDKIVMQEQLQKSDRLNVIGELAAGIAHEIRNPMTALKGFIQLLESCITAEHAMYYQVITSELARIDSIINEFLILAKPQAIRFQEKDINKIIRETVELLDAQAVLYNVQFKTKYNDNLPPLYCEPNQLKKVFINIIKNAIEVMPDGGNVSITIKRTEKNQVKVSIKDEGMGIPKEKMNRLGEPFYTTKERGTGLGLMVSYRIIEDHKGTIQIESEEGKGTVFHINLPLNLNKH